MKKNSKENTLTMNLKRDFYLYRILITINRNNLVES